jgi:quercetin dioxygenase-like cupin family protein
MRFGVAMRDRKFLYGVLCDAVLTLAGVAIAHKNSGNENDTVKPLIVVPGSVPRYSGQQGREGDITELLATSAQTGGKLGIFRQTIAPGSGPPTHLHEMEIEFVYVVSGQFKFKVSDRVVSVPVGTFVFVPPSTVHTFKNIGTNPGVVLFGVTPGGFEKMFAERQGVDADTNKRLMEKYHMQVVGPPLP